MSRPITKGQVFIDTMQHDLAKRVAERIVALGLKQPDVTKQFGMSKIDLHNLVSGRGGVPLARVIMLAVDLDLDVEFRIG